MTAQKDQKLKSLLEGFPPSGVVTYGRLGKLGISNWLVREYIKNGWLTRIGTGAFKRPHDHPGWPQGLQALQSEQNLDIHAGALTALEAHGEFHYARPAGGPVFLFSSSGAVLPQWFRQHDWGVRVAHTRTKLLPPDLGVSEVTVGGAKLRASSRERAILECLHLAPLDVDLVETFHVLEGLNTLRPALMQSLLAACNSTKVVRLFLLMADKAGLPVLQHLDPSKFELGSGPRTVVKGGVYVSKYQLVVPRELDLKESEGA
jgi:hypothetical protein